MYENISEPSTSFSNQDPLAPNADEFDKFYNNFETPKLAPIYTPTEAEFANALSYIAKISEEASKYGIIKIVPPKSFRPPFMLNRAAFNFTPRIQKLNEIDALIKEKITYQMRIKNILEKSKYPCKIPVTNGEDIDLFLLNMMIKRLGGTKAVNENDQWSLIASKLTNSTENLDEFADEIKHFFTNYMEAFNRHIESFSENMDNESDDELEELKQKYQHHHGAMKNEKNLQPISMQGGRPRKRAKKGRVSTNNKMRKSMNEKDYNGLSRLCAECNKDTKTDQLLSCENNDCRVKMHMKCCDPPFETMPENGWICLKCIQEDDRKIGVDFGFRDSETPYDIDSFTEYADDFKCKYFGVKNTSNVETEQVEKEYWKNIYDRKNCVSVKYGADLITSKVGSGFPRKTDDLSDNERKTFANYINHPWNLNNMPILKGSLLSHVDHDISGMVVPWVYVGMCFSTFCWHTEDHWTYSVNYNHWGESKVWYGISGADAVKFEEELRNIAPGLTNRSKDIHHHMTTAVNPFLLQSRGVPVYTVRQQPGEFVITFPRAYHAGFNEGLNVAEAVNFAPVDWLKMGRVCINEYALARRYCVFSYDELLFNMINKQSDLDISMLVEAQNELIQTSNQEELHRSVIRQMGCLKERQESFEELEDELRTCRYCRTTLFLSGIRCQHGHLVCLKDYYKICKICKLSDCILLKKYDIEEINHFLELLEGETSDYYTWKLSVDSTLHDTEDGEKCDYLEIERLIEVAKKKRFPMSGQLKQLTSLKSKYKEATEKLTNLMKPKVQTRLTTRIQRADKRMTFDEIKEFLQYLYDLPFDMYQYCEKLEEFIQKLEEWKKRCEEFLKTIDVESFDAQKSEVANKLIEEGEGFNMKSEEVPELRKFVEVNDWGIKAKEVFDLSQNVESDKMFDKEYLESVNRWSAQKVQRLIDEGRKISHNKTNHLYQNLQNILSIAIEHDFECRQFVQNNDSTINELKDMWSNVKSSHWVSVKYIDEVRYQILQVLTIKKMIGVDLMDENSNFGKVETVKYNELEQVIYIMDSLKILKKTTFYDTVQLANKTFREKMLRLEKIMKPVNSYYHLFSITLKCPELKKLIDGENVPVYKQSQTGEDDWAHLTDFESFDEWKEYCDELDTSFIENLINYRQQNLEKKQSCPCLGSADELSINDLIECFLCNSKSHVGCVFWQPQIEKVHNGIHLCIRCLRSNRPSIDEVQTVINDALTNSFEVKIINYCISKTKLSTERFTNVYEEYRVNKENEELQNRMRNEIFNVISCEIIDESIQLKIEKVINELFDNYLRINQESCLKIKKMRKNAPEVLFVPEDPLIVRGIEGRTVGRKSSRKSVNDHHRKRASANTRCSSTDCIKPTGDETWILCEAGCDRWFHCKCVDINQEEVDTISLWRCKDCMVPSNSSSESSSSI